MEMTDLEKEILNLLNGCRGEANALRRRNLVEILAQLGFEDRQIRESIRHLQLEHNAKIISSPKGYFTADKPQEILRAYEYYMSYAMANLVKASKISDRPLKDLVGQLEIEFRDPPDTIEDRE
jgi:hypothetical protein